MLRKQLTVFGEDQLQETLKSIPDIGLRNPLVVPADIKGGFVLEYDSQIDDLYEELVA